MSCLPTSHCEFSKDGPPIPVEGEDDIEFLPHLNYLGQRQLVVGPVEVGGKIRAECRQADHVLDPEVLVLHTGEPVISILAEVRVLVGNLRKDQEQCLYNLIELVFTQGRIRLIYHGKSLD